jgi:polar amino acid transport system substrate-binding protein
MKIAPYLAAVIVAALVFAGWSVDKPAVTSAPVVKETRLDQIKRTGVLRCGYQTWPPFLTKDPNTGAIGGISHDLMEEAGRQLGFRIEWSGEVATGQMLADLSMNRYDMICTLFVKTPSRMREGDFTYPFVYLPLYLYVRADDKRFDQDFAAANKPEIKLAALDGEFSAIGAAENFPQAARFSVPQLSTSADLFMAVTSKKADAVLQDPETFNGFAKNNPGQLKPAGNKPLRMLPCGFPMPLNEPAFKNAMDATLAYLQDSGFIDATLKKYEGEVRYTRPASGFAEVK